MHPWQREFVEFLVRTGALRFGEFTTKSGRRTPYFINTGAFATGGAVRALGEFYARAFMEHFDGQADLLFGPAYKGIPLVTATAAALAAHGRDMRLAFNRKEAKDHGEGGLIIGSQPRTGDRVVLIEDVTTAGTSVRESAALLGSVADVRIVGLLVSVDRKERGTGSRSALAELESSMGLKARALVTIDDIVGYLSTSSVDGRRVLDAELLVSLAAYRSQYGALV